MLINYSKNKELSTFLFHTISEFENEGDTLVSAIVDGNMVVSSLANIYKTSIGEFIMDQISGYPDKKQILNVNILYIFVYFYVLYYELFMNFYMFTIF